MDISVPTILAAVLPVLATMLAFALALCAVALIGVHPRPKGRTGHH